jgi:hypothetical protein
VTVTGFGIRDSGSGFVTSGPFRIVIPIGAKQGERNRKRWIAGTAKYAGVAAAIQEAVYFSKRLKIRQPFVPPNPKLFDSAYSIPRGRA